MTTASPPAAIDGSAPWHALCLAALLATISGPIHAEIYTWKNASGQTVYSQTPPPDGRARTLVAPAADPRNPESIEQQRRKTRETLQRLRDRQEDRELARQKQTRERAERQWRQEACRKARHNLKGYLSLGHRRVRGKDGVYYHPTDEQRQTLIDNARKQVETYCKTD